ncbi:hypothetical protein [Poritiphilus flavus]|uniref:Uncharacterized protein n=1 Tax=Poritiphilus flavus TaxID=2697053 RepID=A0A6L9E8F0_9FLAO|nr:hypothetical protein [Poritiphilus flavus]NAS10729.1 hypothetical protein [Poritiphilus flavus]
MRKLFFISAIAICLLNCRQGGIEGETIVDPNLEFSGSALTKRTTINAKARVLLKDWPEFNELEAGFDALYQVENNEELVLSIEDLLEKQNALAASQFPESFDIPQVRSRLKVLKTFILKMKAAAEYRIAVQEPALELISAYNALSDQFNVVVNSQLDTELIFED